MLLRLKIPLLEGIPIASRCRPVRGFSLVELLLVVAVIALLATLAVPAMGSFNRAGKLTRVGFDVAGILEQARAYAMAHNTYTWVGFSPEPGDLVMVGVIAARHPGSQPQVTDAALAGSDVIPLGKVRVFANTRILEAPLDDARPEVERAGHLSGNESAILSFSIGSGARKARFDKCVVQFNSRGEARIASGAVLRVMEIGFAAAPDAAAVPANYVAVQIAGLSGNVNVFRP